MVFYRSPFLSLMFTSDHFSSVLMRRWAKIAFLASSLQNSPVIFHEVLEVWPRAFCNPEALPVPLFFSLDSTPSSVSSVWTLILD